MLAAHLRLLPQPDPVTKAKLICWAQTETQQHSRLVGTCAAAYLQGTRELLLPERKATAPKLREQKIRILQVLATLLGL